MPRNYKATKAARGIFGLGSFAQGLEKGLDRRDQFKIKLAETELKRQEKAQTDKEQRDALRLRVLQSMQPQEFPDPSDPTGKRRVTIKGVPQDTVENQFPGLLLSPPAAPPAPIPDVDPGAKGRPVSPPGGGNRAQVSPQLQLESLANLEKLLKNIPTSLGTGVTAGISKLVGGKRGNDSLSVGSDYIKQYEDLKPAASVSFYRALTGDTRLSDSDAKQRAMPILPSVFPVPDTDTTRNGKMAVIKRAFQIAAQEKARNPKAFEDAANDETGSASGALFNSIISKATSQDQNVNPSNLKVGDAFMGGKIKAIRVKGQK